MIIEKTGNIFNTECQTIVNTVNCLGVMGTGLAFEFKLRYPDMYSKYKVLCEQRKIQIGKLWLYSINKEQKVLNFPTKFDWRNPSKIVYLEKGLEKFISTYNVKNITSIAFPLLGASHGGLSPDASLSIMKRYLNDCDIPIEIWTFDPSVSDKFFEKFKFIFQSNQINSLAKQISINQSILIKIENSLRANKFGTFSELLNLNGVGEKTVEKIIQFLALKSP